MHTAFNRVTTFLEEQDVPYTQLEHQPDITAEQTAADTFTPPEEFAKAIILKSDDGWLMAVVAASEKIDLRKMNKALGKAHVQLATEADMETLFPDCEAGAEPPFGHLYGMPVYISPLLSKQEHITFNGGTHTEVIRMFVNDYVRLVNPVRLDMVE